MWPENQRLERAWIPAFSHPNFIPDANTWSLSWSCHYVHVMQHHDIFWQVSKLSSLYLWLHVLLARWSRAHRLCGSQGPLPECCFPSPFGCMHRLDANTAPPARDGTPLVCTRVEDLGGLYVMHHGAREVQGLELGAAAPWSEVPSSSDATLVASRVLSGSASSGTRLGAWICALRKIHCVWFGTMWCLP